MFTSFELDKPFNARNRRKCFDRGESSSSSEEKCHSWDPVFWLPRSLNDVRFFEHDYSKEWKKYILNKNCEEIKNSINSERFVFYTPTIVKCVFNICKMFGQPPEVRYLAVDILDRFMSQHFFKVSETFEQMDSDDSSITEWEAVIERMLQQSQLRILSCVQLAVKYTWSYKVITAKTVQEMLEYLGNKHQYSKRSILKSETRVYQTLNYHLPNKTPLTYLEMFFEDFQKQRLFRIVNLNKLFSTCIHVLDVAIIYHQKVYSDFIKFKSRQEESLVQNYHLTCLKADFTILAASVIYAAVVLEDLGLQKLHDLLECICSSCDCRKADVRNLGKQIVDVILFAIHDSCK